MSKITQASKVITQGTIDNLSLGNKNYFQTFFFQKQNMFAFSSCNMAGNIGSFQSICSLYFIFHLIKKELVSKKCKNSVLNCTRYAYYQFLHTLKLYGITLL